MASESSTKQLDLHPSSLPNAPGPRRLNSLQKLTQLKPNFGSEYGVIAFVLNREMIQADGTLDDLHGMVFHLGSFSTMKAAGKHAKKIIAETGHPVVVPVRYGYALRLTPKFDPAAVEEVAVNPKGEIIKLESAQYRREQKEYQRQIEMEKAMLREAEDETDIDHLEHFKRQAYLAVKNQAKYRMLSQQAEAALADYQKRAQAVQEHYQRHPEHEAEWLPYLKEKLTERGEGELYGIIEAGYQEIREDLLGLNSISSSSSDDVVCSGGICMASTEILEESSNEE